MSSPTSHRVSQDELARRGFDESPRGVHTSRTMMFEELEAVMNGLDSPRSQRQVRSAVVDGNICGKPTYSSRTETASKLISLYSFDQCADLYVAFESLWGQASESRSVLAVLLACCRDSVLRLTATAILEAPPGVAVQKDSIYSCVAKGFSKYTDTTLQSVSRNVMASWKQSGHLKGRKEPVRAKAPSDYLAVTFAVLISILRGDRGIEVFQSPWVALLDLTPSELEVSLQEANRAGLITYRRIGNVVELAVGPNMKEVTS